MELQSLFRLQFKPSFLPRLSHVATSFSSLSNPTFTFFSPKKKFPHLRKPFSPHQSSLSCRTPKPLSVSAASVALQADKDRLPADIEVTETKEPQSRVSYLLPLFPFLSFFFFNWIRLHHINTPKNENQRKWYLGFLVFIINFFFFFIGVHPRKWNQRKCLLGFLAFLFFLSEILFWGSIGSVCFYFPAGEIKCQCSSTSMPGLLQKGVGRILKEVKGIFEFKWLDVLSNVLSSHFRYFFFLVELDHVPTEHLQYMDLELGSSTWLFNLPDLESDKFSCPFDGYQFPIFWGIKWNRQLIVSRSRCVQCDTLKKSQVLEFGWL